MDRFENKKDRFVGRAKESVGKLTDNEEMEFKGKLQGMKADAGDRVEGMKDDVLDKVNELMDKIRPNRRF